MERIDFIIAFFLALNAEIVKVTDVVEDKVFGTVVYDQNDPEERQDFCWHASEQDVPSGLACKLLSGRSNEQLLDLDHISVSQQVLFAKCADLGNATMIEEALNEILDVRIKMVDDGVETDECFIHE